MQLVLEGHRLRILEGGNPQKGLILIFHRYVGGGKVYSRNAKIRLFGIQIYLYPGCYSINGHGHLAGATV